MTVEMLQWWMWAIKQQNNINVYDWWKLYQLRAIYNSIHFEIPPKSMSKVSHFSYLYYWEISQLIIAFTIIISSIISYYSSCYLFLCVSS